MKLTVEDRLQFQYLLPVQGNIETLELVEGILKKLRVEKMDQEEAVFTFTEDEMNLIKNSISVLDKAQKLNLQSLPTIRKIIMEEIR